MSKSHLFPPLEARAGSLSFRSVRVSHWLLRKICNRNHNCLYLNRRTAHEWTFWFLGINSPESQHYLADVNILVLLSLEDQGRIQHFT